MCCSRTFCVLTCPCFFPLVLWIFNSHSCPVLPSLVALLVLVNSCPYLYFLWHSYWHHIWNDNCNESDAMHSQVIDMPWASLLKHQGQLFMLRVQWPRCVTSVAHAGPAEPKGTAQRRGPCAEGIARLQWVITRLSRRKVQGSPLVSLI